MIERVQNKDFTVVHGSANDILVDGLTKALQRLRHAGFAQLDLVMAPKAPKAETPGNARNREIRRKGLAS